MEDDISGDVSGSFGRVIRSLATGYRAENHGYDAETVKKEAQELHKASQGKIGTDEPELVRIFCSRSYPQLSTTFAIYYELYHTDIEAMIRNETSGDFCEALITIGK
jgi:annexin A7/11